MQVSSCIANRSDAGVNPDSRETGFRQKFLLNLLAEAGEFGLFVKCTEYDSGFVNLAVANGDPDASHSAGVMFMRIDRQDAVQITSLTVNQFVVRADPFFNENYIEDNWLQSPFPETQLNKAGWSKRGNKNAEWYVSSPYPEFMLAWFSDWITQTEKIHDSIQQAQRRIKKEKHIAELLAERDD